jgi:hypothetical protein
VTELKRKKIKKGRYQHYKGKFYEVLGVGYHSETLEPLVLYRALYGKKDLWVRPWKMFLEKIRINGKTVPRFKPVRKS